MNAFSVNDFLNLNIFGFDFLYAGGLHVFHLVLLIVNTWLNGKRKYLKICKNAKILDNLDC